MNDGYTVPVLALPSLFAGVCYVWMGAILWGADKRSRSTCLLALVCLLFALWSAGAAGMVVFDGGVYEPVFERLSYFGAGTYTLAGFFFFLSVGNYIGFFRSRKFLFVLCFVPVLVLQSANLGWDLLSARGGASFWYYAHHINGALFTFGGIALLLRRWKKTPYRRERLQILWIFLITLVGVPIGISVDFLLDPQGLIGQANIVPFFWTLGVLFVMRRYGFLRLSHAAMVSTLMSGVDDCVFTLDTALSSVGLNLAAQQFLARPGETAESLPLATVFTDQDSLRQKLVGLAASEASSLGLGLAFTVGESERLLRASAFVIRDRWRDPIGFVLIGREWEGVGDLAKKYRLSKREEEILILILAGVSQREMGNRLCLSLPTIKTHTTGLYNKMGVCSRSEVWSLCSEIK